MKKERHFREEIAEKLQACLKEAGIEAQVDLTAHDAIVHAKPDASTQGLTIIAHITDRSGEEPSHALVSSETVRSMIRSATIRPSLSNRSAGGAASRQD